MSITQYASVQRALMRLGHLPTSAFLRSDHVSSRGRELAKLDQAAASSHEVLASADTVFPFTLFPDTVMLDRDKLTIAHRFFFRVAEVITVRVEDLLLITADVGPFFGSLKITSRFYDARKPYNVNWLWRGDALRLKRLAHGYMIARKQGIDCSKLGIRELAAALGRLGKSDSEEIA